MLQLLQTRNRKSSTATYRITQLQLRNYKTMSFQYDKLAETLQTSHEPDDQFTVRSSGQLFQEAILRR